MRYKVLVIDDMRSIYGAIQQALLDRNCLVDYAENGSLGLQKLIQNPFDLIILDIHMPDHNGLWVCKEIKKIEKYKHIPVLLLTSDIQNLDEGLLAGASDYIIKPFNKTEMIARVFTHIKLSKGRLSLDREKRRLKNEIKEKRRELVEAKSDLEKYFYQTSHKLRSPIYSIKGLMNLIALEHPDIIGNEYMARIRESIMKIERVNEQVSMIGNLRSLSPSRRTIFISEIIDGLFVNGHFTRDHFSVNIDHEIELVTDVDVFLCGLIPVVKNALYYSKRNSEVITRVRIETVSSDDNTYLIVHDDGCGIEQSELDKVFEMFFVGDDQSSGNGLGLFIAKLAFDMIGLKINITSKKDYFTRVIIDITPALLPARTQHEDLYSV